MTLAARRRLRALASIASIASIAIVTACSGGDSSPTSETTDQTPMTMDAQVRINQIQVEGTHNSYHLSMIKNGPLSYEHPPLDVQLRELGARQFELDVHWTPTGFTVFHVPNIDYATSCDTFVDCLTTLSDWSADNPGHQPLFVIVEPKDDFDTDKIAGHYDELEAEVLSVWPRKNVITPDDVRGDHPDLRTAITTDGWPSLGESRDKILFFMLGGTSDYVEPDNLRLDGKLFFPRAEPSDPYAAIIKMDDAEGVEAEIRQRVQEGFIIRSRYTGEDLEFRQARVDAALRGGAQWLSGDAPELFEIPDGSPSRCNPVNAPELCENEGI
jgi:hypothetical protein